jgi:hypothetical protein
MLKWYRIADTFESIVGIDILYQYRPSLHSIGRHLGLFTQSLGRLPVVIFHPARFPLFLSGNISNIPL